jgi:6-phosphogluconolactonase
VSAEFVVRDDLEALSREVAERVAAAARAAAGRRGRCAIALAGGATPRRTYQMLASGERRAAFPWATVSWWWSDERCVPPDHAESNYRMALETLLGPADVAPGQVHRVEGERAPEDAARGYETELRREIPDGALDIVLLGAGSDGHTASLFPGSPALEERERWVLAVEADAAQAVRARVTFTLPLLDRARDVFVLAAGPGKRAVVTAVREDAAAAARRYPVARLAPAGRLTWCVDRAAAG